MFKWAREKWNYIKAESKLRGLKFKKTLGDIIGYSDHQVDFFIYGGILLLLGSVWIAYQEGKFDLSTTVFISAFWSAGFGYWRYIGRPEDS